MMDEPLFPKIHTKKAHNALLCKRCGAKEQYQTIYISRHGLCGDCYKEYQKMFAAWCKAGKPVDDPDRCPDCGERMV